MRERIVVAAVPVFARLGAEAPVIDDFIAAAGIARGTFYRHFKSTDELLVAASNWLEERLMASIRPRVALQSTPEARLAVGVRLWLQHSAGDAELCAFVVRSRFRARTVERELTTDIRDGVRSGKLRVVSVEAARDLVIGAIREAMSRMILERVRPDYLDQVARMILRGLGLDARSVERLLAVPLDAEA